MKRKVTRIGSVKDMTQRLKGVCVFRVVGPCSVTGKKVTFEFTGTRLEAERVQIVGNSNE